MKQNIAIAIAIALGLVASAYAHGPAGHGAKHGSHAAGPVVKEQKDWGIAGDTKAVSRTIRIDMTDDMKFTPNMINVKLNETIRFQVANKGKVLHEMVIGTKKELDDHAEMMKKFPNMEHDEPYMAHVDPGKRDDIVWLFNRAGDFDFACLIPGHYQAGMVGKIKVSR
jgi:uncharacterized cupredoxin-like copper-binding protein